MRMTITQIKNEIIDATFARYTTNDAETHFDIFHLYDTKRECARDNSGYVDARHMEVIGFNTKTKNKRDLGRHDSLTFSGQARVNMTRIFADGSTMIRLDSPQTVFNVQNMEVGTNWKID